MEDLDEKSEIFKDQNKKEKKWNILGFIDGNTELHGKMINNYPVLGGFDWFENHKDTSCVCAVGEPKTKKKIIDELRKKECHFL